MSRRIVVAGWIVLLAVGAVGISTVRTSPSELRAEESEADVLSLVCSGSGATEEEARLMARIDALRKCARALLGKREAAAVESDLNVRLYARAKDGRFPKPVPIGSRLVGWPEAEVNAWIEATIRGSSDNDLRQLAMRPPRYLER